MNQIKVSFIVPVYNMEKYISKCLDEIIKQKINNIEIIIINDGSIDNTLKICREYSKKFNFITIFNKINGGISEARNDGINIAKGEYVCFIDSDDYYKTDFSQFFYDQCKKYDLDIIRGRYSIYDDETHKYLESEKPNISYYNQVISGRKFLRNSIKQHANEVVPWLGFFKREFLIQNNLMFPIGISYEEDQLFFLEALLCHEKSKVMQVDVEFYAYRKRVGSATKTPSVKQAEDILFIVEKENELLKKYKLNNEDKIAAKRYMCSSFYQLTSIYGRVSKSNQKIIMKKIPSWMKYHCLRYPYDLHQFIKVFLFTFASWFVDIIYKLKFRS